MMRIAVKTTGNRRLDVPACYKRLDDAKLIYHGLEVLGIPYGLVRFGFEGSTAATVTSHVVTNLCKIEKQMN